MHLVNMLPEPIWQERQEQLFVRVKNLLEDYFHKRELNCKNPVIDFLFEYYSFDFASLKRWSPGIGVFLLGNKAQEFLQCNFYREFPEGIGLNSNELPKHRLAGARWILQLLKNTASSEAFFGCIGLHEWAMVYRKQNLRHRQIPLRLSPQEIAKFVESQNIHCSHYDAYRFFSKAAVKLNKWRPTKKTMPTWEQPGCLHTNMDLYRWAYKFYPWINSELVVDCFELALEIRKLDMKASPYLLEEYGYSPIAIETSEGKQVYIESQQKFSQRAKPLREKLIAVYESLVSCINGH